MKAGDRVYCHTDYSIYTWRKSFSRGKVYVIDMVGKTSDETVGTFSSKWYGFWIRDDFGSHVGIYSYEFDRYFSDIKELRKKKLERLEVVFNSKVV